MKRRPEWARRDWRPAIIYGSVGLLAAAVLAMCVLGVLGGGGSW